MDRQIWGPGEKEALAKAYANGEEVKDLAVQYNRSESNIRTVLKLQRGCVRQTRMGAKEHRQIEVFVGEGLTDHQIAEKLKKSSSTIKRARTLLALRKYKRSNMAENGWPIGLKPLAIELLDLVEKNRLKPYKELHAVFGGSTKRFSAGIGRLIEKKYIVRKERSAGVVYDLADGVKTMRREYVKKLEGSAR